MPELKLKEKKLLKLLCINSKFTNSELAKSILVTPQAISGMKERLFSQYGSPLVLFKGEMLGFDAYYILLKVEDASLDFSNLRSIDEVIFLYTLSGKYDLQVICYCRNESELLGVLTQIKQKITSNVIDVAYTKHISEDKWVTMLPEIKVDVAIPTASKNVFKSCSKENFGSVASNKTLTLDSTDKKLIREMLKNPQFQFSEVASNLSLTRDVVRHRIKRFIEKDFIQGFTFSINPSAFNYYRYAVFIKEKFPVENFTKLLTSNANIWYAATLFGEYTKVLYINSKNPIDVSETMNEIKTFFGNSLAKVDLVLVEEELYSSQFPHSILDEKEAQL